MGFFAKMGWDVMYYYGWTDSAYESMKAQYPRLPWPPTGDLQRMVIQKHSAAVHWANTNIEDPAIRQLWIDSRRKIKSKKKKLKRRLFIILACLLLVFVAVMMLYVIVVALAGWNAASSASLLGRIKKNAKLLFDRIAPEGGVLRKGLGWINTQYQRFLKPTVEWLKAQVIFITSTLYKTYTLTIGGIVNTYNSLFGWVDGIQVTFNRIMDKTTALIAIVSEDTAKKLDALQKRINKTIDKYTSDLFDKVLNKITETVGPIITKIQEVEAVFTKKTDHLTGLTDRFDKESDYFHDSDGYKEETSDLDTQTAQYEALKDEEEEEEPKPYTPPEEEPERSILDAFMENHTMNIMAGGDTIMAGVENVIDEVVEQITAKKMDYQHFLESSVEDLDPGEYWDDVVLWLAGEITFAKFFRNHWKEIFFKPAGEELLTEEEKEAILKEKRAKRDAAQVESGLPTMP